MKHSQLLFGFAALAILAGCGDSKSTYTPVTPKAVEPANVAAGQEATLFPLTLGNTWRYDVSVSQLTPNGVVPSRAEFLLEVKKANQIEGGVRAEIDVLRGEVLQDTQTWRVDKTGIYQEEIGREKKIKFENQPAMVFPIEMDKPFESKGKAPAPNGQPRDMETTVVCKGIEEVDCMAGTFSAYRVETTQKFKDDKGNPMVALSVVYWAPKVGLIRQKQDVKSGATLLQSQLMVLKQFTIK